MGHWGTGPFENDYAADAQDSYGDLMASGLTVEDAVRALQGPEFMGVPHLPEMLRGLAALLAQAQRLEFDAAHWVETMGIPSYETDNDLMKLALILAGVDCLAPSTARTVLEILAR
jgi:hypothetical protein